MWERLPSLPHVAHLHKKGGRFAPAAVGNAAANRRDHFMFDATNSQFTRFQNASTYFGRALR